MGAASDFFRRGRRALRFHGIWDCARRRIRDADHHLGHTNTPTAMIAEKVRDDSGGCEVACRRLKPTGARSADPLGVTAA